MLCPSPAHPAVGCAAVELLPEEQWRGPSNKLPAGATAGGDAGTAEADAGEEGEEAPEGAHIAQARYGAAGCCPAAVPAGAGDVTR